MGKLRTARSIVRWATSLGLGAALSYLLDRERGAQRRAQARAAWRSLLVGRDRQPLDDEVGPVRSISEAPPGPSAMVDVHLGAMRPAGYSVPGNVVPVRTIGLFAPRSGR